MYMISDSDHRRMLGILEDYASERKDRTDRKGYNKRRMALLLFKKLTRKERVKKQ